MTDREFAITLLALIAILFAGFSCGYTMGENDGRHQEHTHHVAQDSAAHD